MDEAKRDDAGKVRVDLIPPAVLVEVGEVFRLGAEKYGDDNWRGGMRWGRIYASAFRHLLRWWGGATCDKESGRPNLAHAIANLMMLHESERLGFGEDDRPKDDRYKNERAQ